jgi:hypothetical protein
MVPDMSHPAIPATVSAFAEHEPALRAMHGPLVLYVRPQARTVAAAARGAVVFGGWAFLDGEPALLPEGLDLLVLSLEGPGGILNLPRDPRAVLDVLAPYVRRFTNPCPHLAVCVPDEAKARVRNVLFALPDHDPTRPSARDVFPVLEQATWPYRAQVVHTPLFDHPASPIVAFAQGTSQGMAYVTTEDQPGADPRALLGASARSLAASPCELVMMFRGVAATAGRELSAERIVDPSFRAAVHAMLGPEVWIAVPHRYALYAAAVGAAPDDRAAFITVVQHEVARAPGAGYSAVSSLAFRLVDGEIVEAVPIEAVQTIAPSGRGLPHGIRHPGELVAVDEARTELNASILIVGVGAKQLARGIHALGAIGGTLDGPELPGQLEHCCLTLGAVRGWTTRVYVYAFEPDAIDAALAIAGSVNAVIVAHRAEDGWPDAAVAGVARTAFANGAVIGLMGPGTAAAALVGVDLDLIAKYDQDAPKVAFKTVVRRILARLTAS